MSDADFLPGDVVAVNTPTHGKREGLVVGTHFDNVGRQIVEIQFDRPGDYYHAWHPLVTRVRRYTQGSLPYGHWHAPHHHDRRTIERHVHYY
ncbi:hypothetical protein FRC04_000070 [Tulasnella sp. 424]|nr:hypothetical protein FRC04_000070 [Tulasnella sp. 424]KAG8981932.1 hypothetical protein FRC05_000074 [Tulasnella sp. 425]